MKIKRGLLIACTLLAGMTSWIACETEEENEGGANHNVGNNCLVCHQPGGGGEGTFYAGGTVFKAGTTTGATGATISLYSNPEFSGTPVVTMTSQVGGNFYTKSSINFGTGLYVKITSTTGSNSMSIPITSGACNSCHGVSTEKITVQ